MTRDNVERKQARTEEERIEDEDDEFIEEEEEGSVLCTSWYQNSLSELNLDVNRNVLKKILNFNVDKWIENLLVATKVQMMYNYTRMKVQNDV